MPNTTLSRRSFSKLVGGSAAYAAFGSTAFADLLPRVSPSTAAVVRLSSNENPYGPSPDALKAMTEDFTLAWR